MRTFSKNKNDKHSASIGEDARAKIWVKSKRVDMNPVQVSTFISKKYEARGVGRESLLYEFVSFVFFWYSQGSCVMEHNSPRDVV